VSLSNEGGVSLAKVNTTTGCFREQNPFLQPPGTNFLPNVYTNAFDGNGKEMLNTLPSTPANPYNLHDGEPVITRIERTSPTDDLYAIYLDMLEKAADRHWTTYDQKQIERRLQRGIDIMEGNPVPNRVYSGLPLLHYKAAEKSKAVTPIKDASGNTIGGNVDIHQVWYDTHIESDTAYVDPTAVSDVPWTITYTVDTLNRGHDDFSPFVMYFDDPALSPPGKPPMPHVAMDQSFFNMEDGTRTVFKIKMAPGKYFNLIYTWGWRAHPPRVQVTENAKKLIAGKTLLQWEQGVFGTNPSADKEKAIAQLGELAPEKRIWNALRSAQQIVRKGLTDQRALTTDEYNEFGEQITEARESFRDWRDRTRLPRGFNKDSNSDLTLLYIGNTIYAELTDGGRMDFPKWSVRGTTLKVTLYNADHFPHSYQNVDFGGSRGWENQFKSSVRIGGSGCWFTFGRVHWWMNLPMALGDGQPFMVMVPPAAPGSNRPGAYKVEITYNYEPSRRLRFYQFDPIHHDVSVFSVH
jgi:hypothetical protein